MRFHGHLLGLAALGLGMAACSGADDAAPPTSAAGEQHAAVTVPAGDSAIVTQVEFNDGRSFRFIEAAPGNIMMDELGPAGVTPTARRVNISGLAPLEVFARIAPEATPPVKLLDADARRVELAAKLKDAPIENTRPKFAAVPDEQPSDLTAGPANGLVEKAIDDSACPASWFTSQLCYQCNDYDWKVCNTLRSGVNSYQRSGSSFGESVVCTYRGNTDYRVRVRPVFTWQTTLNVSVPAGFYHWSKHDQLIKFDYEFRGDGGSGGYHIGGMGFTDFSAHGPCGSGLLP
jgi:hypothetical protein